MEVTSRKVNARENDPGQKKKGRGGIPVKSEGEGEINFGGKKEFEQRGKLIKTGVW